MGRKAVMEARALRKGLSRTRFMTYVKEQTELWLVGCPVAVYAGSGAKVIYPAV